jgi:16S rRNA processing protein RimM
LSEHFEKDVHFFCAYSLIKGFINNQELYSSAFLEIIIFSKIPLPSFMNNYFKIGKLAATFGLEGQLILEHSLGKKTSLKGLENIFIEEFKDSFLPYFIESAKIKSEKEIYIKLEGITTKEEARGLIKKEAWLIEKDFKKFSADAAPISLLGFMVVNENEELGEVCEVIEQPHQLLCKIILEGKEVLIPIHEDSLEKIDKKNRKLFLNLPEGLLDIYRDA